MQNLNRRLKLLILLFVFFSFSISGCYKPGLPSSDEQDALSSGDLSLVFFRERDLSSLNRVWYGIRSFDYWIPGEWGPHYRRRQFSENASKAGWFYWLFEPGIYYLTLHHEDAEKNRTYSLNVPNDRPVIYAGTLDQSYIVQNEENLAKEFASQVIGMQPLHVELMAPYASETLIFRTPKSRLKELEVIEK